MPTSDIADLIKAFRTGYSHMAVICEDEASAKEQKRYAEEVQKLANEWQNQYKEDGSYGELPGFSFAQDDMKCSGILTLENAIESVLKTDILDERDRDSIIYNLDENVKHGRARRQVSMRYTGQNVEFPSVSPTGEKSTNAEGDRDQIAMQYQTSFAKVYADTLNRLVRESINNEENQQVGSGTGINSSLLEKRVDQEN